MLPIEVATHEHPEAGTGAAAALFVELEHDALEGDGVVAATTRSSSWQRICVRSWRRMGTNAL